jgi:hypothetical protein
MSKELKKLKKLIKESVIDAIQQDKLFRHGIFDPPPAELKSPQHMQALRAMVGAAVSDARKQQNKTSEIASPQSNKQTPLQRPLFWRNGQDLIKQLSGTSAGPGPLTKVAMLHERYPEVYTTQLLSDLLNKKPEAKKSFLKAVANQISTTKPSKKGGSPLALLYSAAEALENEGFLPVGTSNKIYNLLDKRDLFLEKKTGLKSNRQ